MNKVIEDFGSEWERFNYLDERHANFIEQQFQNYLKPIPDDFLSESASVAADFGAGSGRWTRELAKRVKLVHAIEPSDGAFTILSQAFSGNPRVIAHHASIETVQLNSNSLDFAMSLGVLHHIEGTQEGLSRIFSFIKPGGIFLGYLYYNLENKPAWYKSLWKVSNFARRIVSALPSSIKAWVSDLLAIFVYWPLARISRLLSHFGVPINNLPLHHYAERSLYVMRNDALDRFGTRLEKRFSKSDIKKLLIVAGADPESVKFSDEEPFWCFSAFKA